MEIKVHSHLEPYKTAVIKVKDFERPIISKRYFLSVVSKMNLVNGDFLVRDNRDDPNVLVSDQKKQFWFCTL